MKQTTQTTNKVNYKISNPIISSDEEVFTDKREFVNHCLMVLGHQTGLVYKQYLPNQWTEHTLHYTDKFGKNRIWCTSTISKQHLYDVAFEVAFSICNNLNNNRTYDTKWSLADAINNAREAGEDATYWQNLYNKLVSNS